jgi:hypothetical protein
MEESATAVDKRKEAPTDEAPAPQGAAFIEPSSKKAKTPSP